MVHTAEAAAPKPPHTTNALRRGWSRRQWQTHRKIAWKQRGARAAQESACGRRRPASSSVGLGRLCSAATSGKSRQSTSAVAPPSLVVEAAPASSPSDPAAANPSAPIPLLLLLLLLLLILPPC
jgi:hypothetical protein